MSSDSTKSKTGVFQKHAPEKISPAAFLSAGSEVVGELTFNGPATLSGRVKGTITSKYRLEVDEGAQISADIHGAEVIVKGIVKGDITASDSLLVLQPGQVIGNVDCVSIQIEEGAIFEGSCKMNGSSASTK